MPFEKTKIAREGRENQAYAESGARLVAGTVSLNGDRTKLLMISSESHPGQWVIPKGGIETDESDDYQKAAKRETWEEAGVVGNITKSLGIIEDMRPPKKWPVGEDGWPPRTEFHFFEMEVKEVADEWPESYKRQRKWSDYNEALFELERAGRKELMEAVKRSSVRARVRPET